MKEETSGQAMHDGDAERRREAARALGQAKTPAKAASSRANGATRKGTKLTDEQKERIRVARWGDKPRKEPQPARPRGRPRKVAPEATESAAAVLALNSSAQE